MKTTKEDFIKTMENRVPKKKDFADTLTVMKRHEEVTVYVSTTQPLDSIFRNGILPNGTTQDDIDVILVQLKEFYLPNRNYYQIRAKAFMGEIYVDLDDHDAEFDDLSDNHEYLSTPISDLNWIDHSGVGYGLFMRELPFNRIKTVELILGDETGINAQIKIHPINTMYRWD